MKRRVMVHLYAVLLACAAWLAAGCTIAPPAQPLNHSAGSQSVRLADGKTLAYRSVGTNHKTTPIVLIHGIPDSSDSWNSIAVSLGRSHPIYAVDLAGYGYSERSEGDDASLSAQANYLSDFLDKMGIGRAVLVGHDIGGGVAQIIAARKPEYVDRLILINSVVDDHWPVPEMRLLRVPLLSYISLTLMERPLWEHMLGKGFSSQERVTDAVIQRYQHWYQGSSGRQRLIRNAQALDNADLTSISDAIRALPIPTMILWGRNDRYLDAEPPKKLCQSMKNCRFVFIDDAGHFVLDEQPQRVSSLIDQFLRE